MSLGLPSHLARRANNRALASAARAAALVALTAAVVSVIVPGVAAAAGAATGASGTGAGIGGAPGTPGAPGSTGSTGETGAFVIGSAGQAASEANGLLLAFGVPWVGVIAILPLAAMLIALTRGRTVALGAATLIIGMGSTFVYTITLLAQNPGYVNTDLFVITLPVIALTLIGGTGSGSMVGVIWASAGFALGEIAVFAAAVVAGREFAFSATSLGFYLMMVGVLALDGFSRNSQRGIQASILRTMRIEHEAVLRQRMAADAAADLHDTTLSQLTLIAQAEPGPLRPKMRARIERDLAAWGRDRTDALQRDASRANTIDELWRASDLADAIEQGRDEGLDIEVSGDYAAIARLNPERMRAAGRAVRQCLANVLRHSGQLSAQITLSAGRHEVSIMVVDAGRGFDDSAAPDGRLGLQHSIRERIERVGGSVVVFSHPGEGTSISMTVPATDAARDGGRDAAGDGSRDAAGDADPDSAGHARSDGAAAAGRDGAGDAAGAADLGEVSS